MSGSEVVLTGLGEVTVRRAQPPEAPPRGVVVRTEAAGVAFAEVQMRRGRYPAQPAFPFVPGYDLVGEIVAAGPGSTWKTGQRVAAMPRTGAWAEHVALHDRDLVEVPDSVDAAEAVSLVLNGVTARQLLRAANVRTGHSILVHGIGGGVGALLAQLAVADGIRVIGTASGHRHADLADIGAELIDHRAQDVAAEVTELAPGGVDAVFDPLGPSSLPTSWRLLAPGGTLVSYGSSTTLHESGPWWRPYLGIARQLANWEVRRLLGRTGGRRTRLYYVRADQRSRADLSALLRMVASGRLRPLIAARMPLEEAERALDLHLSGKKTGRIVLIPGSGQAAGPKC
ncbi:medium chain dehydrogenase/reductase family protein [Saccharopolyspora mangrovi]|uniref:Medium chain dehydrogenase/reductase family protein n=1 Tax=Saccharopolyspora mangrovi TaxID=3082379 RepID=A0ABU6ALI8_9PSEU|nr:medium chain dehydrogenase/reductase family protein [Saccharopolyspora sp. S2-29]MEB3372378.1 medium chain dehydrogenase/reductase family protein [Saccharopolyspora sp. S2-29]